MVTWEAAQTPELRDPRQDLEGGTVTTWSSQAESSSGVELLASCASLETLNSREAPEEKCFSLGSRTGKTWNSYLILTLLSCLSHSATRDHQSSW